jgi:type I restriction enzyme R subunit
MFCVSSVEILIKYYELLKAKKEAGEHRLNIATIFSYAPNPEDADANGEILEEDFPDLMMAAEPTTAYGTIPRKDKLDEYINDFNKQFNTKHSAKDGNTFLNYKKDISKRVKNKQIDILLVVNMFLTGFDSKSLNTLYVDKNLNYHGLIQAYSRTNRILNEKKSQGNILAFRNLKQNTDDAIALFSDKNAQETIIIAPYEEQIKKFNEAYKVLMGIAPTVDSVNDLATEEDELEFAKAFREIMRLKNILSSFVEFTFEDTYMKDQEFADYTSKYLDLYDKIKTNNQKESVSILDEINVAYIMKLLAQLKNAKPKDQAKQKKQIIDLISGESDLRSKRVLIEKFIQNNLPKISDSEAIEDEFKNYWQEETKIALQELSTTETLKQEKVEEIINDYLFTGRMATEDEVIEALEKQPSVLQRESISTRITEKIKDFVKTFINGVDNS